MLRNTIFAVAVAIACSALAPASARANHGGFNVDFCNDHCVFAVLSVVVGPPLVLITAQSVYAAKGRWFPLGWAVPELIYGTAMTSLIVGYAVAGDWNAKGTAVVASLYGWLTLHGALSLALDEPKAREPTELRAVAAPTQGGAWLGLAGAW